MLGFVMRSDWRYLTRHAAEGVSPAHEDDVAPTRDGARDYYTSGEEHGEPAGVWWGRGAASLGQTGEVSESVMERLYGGLVDPRTGEVLGTRPRTYMTFDERLAALLAKEPEATPERRAELALAAHKSHREARHYADLTFSPPKSWSVLHAALEHAGRHEDAQAVWDSWMTGVHAGLEYLMDEAGYSRAGYHHAPVAGRTTGRWVDAHDWVVSIWRHHTSRDGDPQLHVHAAVVNRVQCPDGVWRSLDSQAIASARPAAGAIAERTAEEDLSGRLGPEFWMRPDGIAREIVGIDEAVRDLFSSRRRAISAGTAELAASYEQRHGHAPSAYVLRLMAEHVTLKTRARKPEQSPGREELLDRWDQAVRSQLGGTLDSVIASVQLDPDRPRQAAVFSPEHVIQQAIADVEATKAVWNRHDLVAAIVRHLPDELGALEPQQVRSLVDDLADQALHRDLVVVPLMVPELIPVPAELRREDGRSAFEPHRPERYATAHQLEREESLLTVARQHGGPQLAAPEVDRAIAGTGLDGDQAAAVRSILGSGKRLEVLVGPAGTGKSYTIGALTQLWRDGFETDVFGIAVAQNAVQVLRQEGIEHGANVSQFLAAHERMRTGSATTEDRARYSLRRNQLVVIDEASMISTVDLTKVVQIATSSGAKVLVTGDHRQLGAIDAGGAMQLLEERVGALELHEVRRFSHEWEGQASLQLRDGDARALLEYDRRGRLLQGPAEDMLRAAFEGFLDDHLAGKRSLLIVDDGERAAQVSSEVRRALVALARVEEEGVQLHDGTVAGVGDVIQTRKNAYRMVDPVTTERYDVVNREVWLVTGRSDDGGLVVHAQLEGDNGGARWGRERHLPGAYVREHVTLAYAQTAHAAEGRTADTAHVLVDQSMDRPALYVGLSRGMQSNVAYVAVEGDQHRLDRLSAMLEHDDVERTAVQVQADEFEAADHLGRLGPQWTDLVAMDASERYRTVLHDALGEERGRRVDADTASGPLYRLVRSAELDGHNAEELLTHAVHARELDSAESIAQVLHHRIERRMEREAEAAERPEHEEFLPGSYTDRTPARDDEIGRYVAQLAEAMDRRTDRLGEEAAQSPPSWAIERLGPVPDDPTARAEWTARAASVAAYREHFGHEDPANPIGEAPGRGEPERRAAWQQAATALGMPRTEQDLAARSEGELRNHVAAYDRETEWMPPNVDDRLRVAHLAQREAEGGAARRQAEQDAMLPGDPRRDAHAQRVQQARALAEALAQRTARLEEIAEARSAAVASVADVEERARAARAELRRRGPDLEQEQRGREQAGERRDDAERHHDAINVPSRSAPSEVERPDIAAERGESPRAATVDDRGEPGRDDSTNSDRRIERDLERARAAMARIAERREEERHEPERDDEHERVHERDGIDIGDER